MYCKKCGTELRENDTFCYYCGNRIGWMQRMLSSKAFIGSVIAVFVVIIAAVLTYLIWTGKITMSSFDKGQTTEQNKIVDSGKSGKDSDNPAAKATATPAPTATPYAFTPSDVTKTMKKEMKPLTERLKPFLAYSASFYANGSHRFKFDTTFVTTMAIFNLEHSDKTLRYGDSMSKVKKEAKKEIKKIFGSNYKYKFAYTGTYPGYVYRPTGNTIVFNSMRIPGKDYQMKVKKITEYEEGKYRLTVEAYLTNVASNTKGEIQKYTVLAAKDEQSEYGYIVEKIKLKK